MAEHVVPHFQNDAGADKIRIGVKEFQCMGASPPFDHPHVFLDMGKENQVICGYCSTVYVHDAKLKPTDTVPPGCLHTQDEAA
ncbi:MAG: zinc-finger domain-containing protein [Pseudomonadota bacterium]|nr:zinc-finger domain-containing protein [Pseudomonadota bacterium]